MLQKITIPQKLSSLNKVFKTSGFEAFLVGGAVRDMILNKKATDWDVATNATPEQVTALFPRVIPTGIAHGTVTVFFTGTQIEVTTYRTEADYSDGRHPDKVSYAATIQEDLSRRDFTMNAIAANLDDGSLVDPFDGISDIKSGLIRTVGNPSERFNEDGLRPVRAVRFAAQLGFKIDEATLKAIPLAKEKTACISIERFRDELIKLLGSQEPSVGLKLMEQTGILDHFLPELSICRGVIQADARGHHQFDVLDHLFYATDGAPRDNLNVRLAALFHDVGKPLVRKVEQRNDSNGNSCEIYTFYNHEIASSKIADKVLTRLRFPVKTVQYVSHLVKQHMFHYESTWSDGAVRRFLARVTPEAVPDLFDLRLADVYGMTRKPVLISSCGLPAEPLIELQERIDKFTASQTALTLKDLAVNGKDLMAIGIPSGKDIGIILGKLLDTVLDDPVQNTKEKLLEIAKNVFDNSAY